MISCRIQAFYTLSLHSLDFKRGLAGDHDLAVKLMYDYVLAGYLVNLRSFLLYLSPMTPLGTSVGALPLDSSV